MWLVYFLKDGLPVFTQYYKVVVFVLVFFLSVYKCFPALFQAGCPQSSTKMWAAVAICSITFQVGKILFTCSDLHFLIIVDRINAFV